MCQRLRSPEKLILFFPRLQDLRLASHQPRPSQRNSVRLAAAVIAAGKARGTLDREQEVSMVNALSGVPRLISEGFALDEPIAALAYDLSKARDVIYLGRGVHYPIALGRRTKAERNQLYSR